MTDPLPLPKIYPHACSPRLDGRKRELQQKKDELIKETKAKVAAIDNVRQQLDIFLKVCILSEVSCVRG